MMMIQTTNSPTTPTRGRRAALPSTRTTTTTTRLLLISCLSFSFTFVCFQFIFFCYYNTTTATYFQAVVQQQHPSIHEGPLLQTQSGSTNHSSLTTSTSPSLPHSNATTNFVFTWDDVIMKQQQKGNYKYQPICGNYKCFFYSKSHPKSLGYMIGSKRPYIQRAYDIAVGIDVLLLLNTSMTSRRQQRRRRQKQDPLDVDIYPQNRHHFYRTDIKPIRRSGKESIPVKVRKIMNQGKKQSRLMNAQHKLVVYIQPMVTIPNFNEELYILGCSNSRFNATQTILDIKQHLFSFGGEMLLQEENDDISSMQQRQQQQQKKKDIIMNTFEYSIINNTINKVLYNYPHLVDDFQLLLDKFGRAYHFDLDRGGSNPNDARYLNRNSTSYTRCISNLHTMVQLLKNSSTMITTTITTTTTITNNEITTATYQ